MSVKSRELKVLAAFLTSLTAGVIILMALGNDPPPAGAFCLSGYYGLEPVEKVILAELAQPPGRWDRIVVHYSGTQGGNIEQLLSVASHDSPENITCHFVVCNGFGGADGQIQPSEKWRRQRSITRGGTLDRGGQTIYICVIANGKTARPTDLQIKRAEALIEALCREFNIEIESVHCPHDWQ
jgi:hypothetical protein